MPYDSEILIDKLLNIMMDNKLESGSKILYITKKKLVSTINIILKNPIITHTFLVIEKTTIMIEDYLEVP